MLSGIANSVDHDQNTPSGAVSFSPALLAYAILPESLMNTILGHLQYIKDTGNIWTDI